MSKRADILNAIQDAVAGVEIISRSTMGVAMLGTPGLGLVVSDVSLGEEKSERISGNPFTGGVLDRVLKVAVTLETLLDDEMDALAFENQVVDPVEAAIANHLPLYDLVDDWYVGETRWAYSQDSTNGDTIASEIIIMVIYKTPTPSLAGRL